MSRAVIVVTYFFPPVGGVGVLRTLKYVKYLPRWGWQPTVIAPRDPAYAVRDESLLRSIPPDVDVLRTLSLEPSRLVTKARRRARTPEAMTPARPVDQVPASGLPGAMDRSTGRRLIGLAASYWTRAWDAVLFPDQGLAWLPSAVAAGLREIRRREPAVIYSSSPPVSCHVIAGALAGLAHLPWVADFRDPWIGNAFASPMPRLKRPLQHRLERWIVERADRIILVSDSIARAFADRYPDSVDRLRVIPNGYDRDDLPSPGDARAARDARASDTFRLVYAGSLYGERELAVFLTGLELLVAHRPELRKRLEVQFVGRLNAPNERIAGDYARRDELAGMLTFTGFLPHDEAMRRIASADALLQLIADDPQKSEIVGGKLSEYVGLDRPILAVAPEGEARAMLRDLGCGVLADPTPSGVAIGLEQLLEMDAQQGPSDPEGRYDRRNLAGRLAAVLEEVVSERSARTQVASPKRT